MKTYSFVTAKKILFGVGAVEQLGEELKNLSAKKVAIISDPVVKKAGWV
ncbi:MAG: iron-containing alcohol dehydrogenase, partial [Dehalococcoidia bacterium]